MKKKKCAQSFGIIGLGRFGMALAISLTQAGKEVVVIDINESKVREIRQYTDYAFVVPDLNMETLQESGIQNCDVVVVCIGEKIDICILTTMRVVEMGVPRQGDQPGSRCCLGKAGGGGCISGKRHGAAFRQKAGIQQFPGLYIPGQQRRDPPDKSTGQLSWPSGAGTGYPKRIRLEYHCY